MNVPNNPVKIQKINDGKCTLVNISNIPRLTSSIEKAVGIWLGNKLRCTSKITKDGILLNGDYFDLLTKGLTFNFALGELQLKGIR